MFFKSHSGANDGLCPSFVPLPFLHFPDNGIIFAENHLSERNFLSYEKTMDNLGKHEPSRANDAGVVAGPDKTR